MKNFHNRETAVTERVFDEATGKTNSKLRFELPAGATKSKLSAPVELSKKGTASVMGLATGKLHQKVYEVEHENVGVKAAHRVEMILESSGKRAASSALRYARNKPYRTVEKLEAKAAKANVNYNYQRALNNNPRLRSNIFSRYMQKRKIKQQYAKTIKAGQSIKATVDTAEKLGKAISNVVRKNPKLIAILAIIAILIFLIYSMLSMASNVANATLSSVFMSSYVAEDPDIDNAELIYSEWETDLLDKIAQIEQDYPGYDEYRYNVDNVGHNPYELISYLTVRYKDFHYADILSDLERLFNEQYKLDITEITEVKYRTVTRVDPYTGEEYEEQEAYDWRVLNIKLTARSFTDVAMESLEIAQKEHYTLLTETKGFRQYISSPFSFNWLPSVSSHYGYRSDPMNAGKEYHKGVDIAVPTGTEIHAGHDGTVTFAGMNGGYGNVVVIEDDNGLVTKYAHCDAVLVNVGQQVKSGDIIAKSGNTGNSTGPHLHLEIIKDGQYLNPVYFAETNDIGTSTPVYSDPGEAMGDGSYAALIAEAEKYLGYPYVWGGSSPSTSFDCSGFVTWVFNQSGAASFGRTTAQGLYNMSTPVSPEDARPGDLVFFHSTYSTANTVTHVGIYVGDGKMIHAGDPIQYTSINTSYWQKHMYAYGRLS